MKCTLEGSNARVIAKAIQSLSKVGKELFVEADEQGLQMRAINATHSAVGSIRFKRSMFETFHLPDNADCYCKIGMKPCLGVFRNMRQVEHCELCLMEDQSKFQVKLRCKLETIKQALISIVDEQNINAAVPVDQSVNTIQGTYKLFMEISNSFPSSEEELTLEANADSLVAKNYIEGARVNDRFMRSQLKLKPCEFENYNITQDAVITFCLKEFRAFMLFAESLNAHMTLEFDNAGSPSFLKIKKHNEIECLLIMSTLCPEDISYSEDYCQREITAQDGESAAQKRKSSAPGPPIEHKRRLAEDTTLSTSDVDTALFQFNDKRTMQRSEAASVEPARLLAEGDTIADNDDDDDAILVAIADAVDASQAAAPSSNEICFYNTDDVPDTQVPEVDAPSKGMDEESIPQSPERVSIVRTIFSRCFQNTYVPREPSPNSQVYAPNSDTED